MASESSDSEVVLNLRNLENSEFEIRSEASVTSSMSTGRHRRRQRATPVPPCTSESDSEAGSSPVRRHGRAQNLNFNNVGVDRCNNWRASEHVPHLKPEPYSGEEPWESYISHFEDCAELGVWSQRSRVLFLASSLRGKARQFYMSLDEYERRDYCTLVKRMKQRFGSSVHESKYLGMLENRQRRPGESIISLCDDIRQLTKKAYSQLNTQSQDIVALNQLYKIISPEMKCRCIDNNCSSIHEAAAVIDKYESILGYDQQRSSRVRAVDTNGIDRKLSGLIKGLDSRLERLESVSLARSTQQSLKTKSESRKCFKCRSEAHLFRDCPQRERQSFGEVSRNVPAHLSQGNGSRSTQ